MRLKKTRSAADEELLRLVNDGYHLIQETETDFMAREEAPSLDERAETARAKAQFACWTDGVVRSLQEIFPTKREAYVFARSTSADPLIDLQVPHDIFWGQMQRMERFVRRLDAIRLTELGLYTDLPMGARLYVEDIDSFSKVRDVNPTMVGDALKDGRVDLSEDHVQVALEQILSVSFHRRDWGGETNDLYTANVVVNGARTAAAFALKGHGCKSRELGIADCGKRGDQLVRLLESPASLFVIQYVGPISDAVVKDVAGKVEQLRAIGKQSQFCVIDGQDTARLLKAYGMPLPNARASRGPKRAAAPTRRR